MTQPPQFRLVTETTGRNLFVPADLALLGRQELDIWDGFNAFSPPGYTNNWPARTYSDWIAGIDNLLSGEIAAGRVIRQDLGASSDPTRHVYAYTAGPANAPHMLLTGGEHPDEVLSQRAPMRWFQQFAMGTHPVMKMLRSAVRVTWIPTANPSAYLETKASTSGVNLNRNYDFFWDQYVPPSPEKNKGPTPFSEPETQMYKNLLDNTKISAIVACHTTTFTESARNEMNYVSPSVLIASRRDINYVTGSHWDQIYNKTGIPVREMTDFGSYAEIPRLASWATVYMRYVKKRYNTAFVSVESPEGWFGAEWDSGNREGIRHYCGFITLWVVNWLTMGQQPAVLPTHEWHIGFDNWTAEKDAIALGAGGTRIVNPDYEPVTFNYSDPTPQSASGWTDKNSIRVAAPCPGYFTVNFDGYLQTISTGGSVTVAVGKGKVPAAPTADNRSLCIVSLPAEAGKTAPFSGSLRINATDPLRIGKDMHELQLLFKFTTGTGHALLRRCRMTVRFTPSELDNEYQPLPQITGSYSL